MDASTEGLQPKTLAHISIEMNERLQSNILWLCGQIADCFKWYCIAAQREKGECRGQKGSTVGVKGFGNVYKRTLKFNLCKYT